MGTQRRYGGKMVGAKDSSHRIRLLAVTLAMLLAAPAAFGQGLVDAVGDPLPKGFAFRLGTVRLRHWVASGTCFTPDGKRLLSVGRTDECLEWDVATGKLVRSLPQDSFPLAFSGDSRLSASWIKGEIQVMEWPAAKRIHSIPLKKLRSVVFAKDGKTLVALTSDHWVHRWDLASAKELSRKYFPLVDREYWVDPPGQLSPDGKTLAGVLHRERSDIDKTIPLRFWDVATGEEVRASLPVGRSYYDCRWSPDGSRLFALALPYGLEIWDLKTGKKVEAGKEEPGVKGTKLEIKVGDSKAGEKTAVKESPSIGAEIVEVTPDGQSLLIAMFGELVNYDLAAGKSRWRRSIAPQASGPGLKLSTVISFSFSPVSKTVAVGCSCGHIALLDWTTGKDVEASSRHPGFFKGPVSFSKDGASMLLTDGMTERLLLHDARTGKLLHKLAATGFLAWSPDGKRFADSHWNGLKEIGSEKELWRVPAWPYEAWFSADGKSLMYRDLNDRTFHRVDTDTGKEQHVFRLPAEVRKNADSKAISPDWKRVAVSAKQAPPLAAVPGWLELQVWDIDGQKRWTWKIPDNWRGGWWEARFLPGNKHLVVDGYIENTGGVLCVFEAETGRKACEIATGGSDSFTGASPNGRSIVVAGKEATEFRDVTTGRLLFQYKQIGIRGYLQDIAFSPNGELCAFCTDDFTVEVRELATGKTVNKFHRPDCFFRNIAFAPDNRTMALTFNDCTVWMWDSLAEMKH
jgi:WD40 repeat protein